MLKPFVSEFRPDLFVRLARHWLGGEAYNAPPLANFLNNLKTRADIGTKLTVPYSASIQHPQTWFQRHLLRRFWENGVLVTSCHAILGRNSAKIQMLLECRISKKSATNKHLNMYNRTLYKTAISDFSKFRTLYHSTLFWTLYTLYKIALKIKIWINRK